MKNKIKKIFTVNRTIPRAIEDIAKGRRRIRMVVLGSKGSGKTVFLTALASNLINHRLPKDGDPDGFDLKGWEARFHEAPAGELIADFPYNRYRAGFAKSLPEWPEKTTTEMSVLRLPLDFMKRGRRNKSVLIELLDLPGERIADLSMVGKSFIEWCRWFEDRFAGSYSADKTAAEYLDAAKECRTTEELFSVYKTYLKVEHERYSPWVVPSIVKLTKEGKGTKFLDELPGRPLGLDENSQFVPLPISFFDKNSTHKEWVKEFSDAYDKYKKEIVSPIALWLREADQLVYLLDVLNILRCGVAAYNHEMKFAEAVFDVFSRRKSRRWRVLGYFASMLATRIKNAFVVVPKRDLADSSENLISLADGMLGKELRWLLGKEQEFNIRTCAAVDTIRRTTEGDREVLYARVAKDRAGDEEYVQVQVPKKWPKDNAWEKAVKDCVYGFHDTFPQFDKREDASPSQWGLDDLAFALLKNVLGD